MSDLAAAVVPSTPSLKIHSNRLDGKVALITGGCSGIGLATVELFVANGAQVIVADIDVPGGEQLMRDYPGRVDFARCNILNEADIRQAVEIADAKYGRLDVMFNNASATGTHEPLESMTIDAWDGTMDLVLRSVLLGIRHCVPLMKKAGSGAIINTASVAGLRAGIGTAAYSVAKAGVLHLTRVAALEFAPYKIRVNSICPGVIPTPVFGGALGLSKSEANLVLSALQKIASTAQPIMQSGSPRDIAEACLYFASDSGSFVSGTHLVVDGGLTQLSPQGFRQSLEDIARACMPS